MRILIKLGGTLIEAADSRERLAREITELAAHDEVVVVHGGGKQMTRFLAERGVESTFIEGLRVTTPDVMDAVVKVFAGSVNAELVTTLRAAGALPVGLSGLSAGLVDAVQLNPALGQVGRPISSDGRLLRLLVGAGYLPVVACVAGDANGSIFNVNGDQMAVACATGFKAETLVFLTDVDGVRDHAGATRRELTIEEVSTLILNNVATGGMQAKLESAVTALRQGVSKVLIAPGARAGILRLLRDGNSAGTKVIP